MLLIIDSLSVRQGVFISSLKPIAKTLSVTMEMAECAKKNNVACFCADLTVNPVMVSWNQCVASRLPKLPGMLVGVVESNGAQNYVNWDKMLCFIKDLYCEIVCF